MIIRMIILTLYTQKLTKWSRFGKFLQTPMMTFTRKNVQKFGKQDKQEGFKSRLLLLKSWSEWSWHYFVVEGLKNQYPERKVLWRKRETGSCGEKANYRNAFLSNMLIKILRKCSLPDLRKRKLRSAVQLVGEGEKVKICWNCHTLGQEWGQTAQVRGLQEGAKLATRCQTEDIGRHKESVQKMQERRMEKRRTRTIENSDFKIF